MKRTGRVAGLCLALLVALGLLSSAPAWAWRPTVAVAPFRGPGNVEVSRVVQAALKARSVVVITPSRYALIAKGLFAQGTNPGDIAAVAQELGAGWVVTGNNRLEARRWTLVVSLRDGKTGHTMAKLQYPLASPHVPPTILRTMSTELLDALQAAVSAPSAPPIRPANDKEKPPSWDPQKPDPVATREPAPERVPDTGAPAPLQPTPVPTTPAKPEVRPKWAHWFELGIGFGLTGRNFSADPPPPRVANALAPTLRLDGTVYPLAFSWKRAYGLFAGLGLGLSLDLPFWPAFTAKTDATQTLPAAEFRVEGGLRWKLTLYKPLPRPQLTLLVEGGLHQFLFANAADGARLVGTPDVRYIYAAIGGRFTVHFADWSWIWAQFQYHAVTDSGPIQLRANYGVAATVGFRFSAGLDFLVWRGIRLGAQGSYERFAARYGYDPDAVQKRSTSIDEYFGAVLVLGYVF